MSKSTVENPVVVMMEETWKAESVSAWKALADVPSRLIKITAVAVRAMIR